MISKLAALSVKAKVLIACITTAVVAAGVAAAVMLTAEDTYRLLKVFEMMGTSKVDRASAGELDAYVGMNLENDDTVSVGADSNLRLELDSDKYILLDSNTVINLVAKGSAEKARTFIELYQGTILNEITNKLNADSAYEVNTPKATMAVRGTSFSVTVTGNDADGYVTELAVLHGTVSVQLKDEDGNLKGEEVLVTQGKSVMIYTAPNDDTKNSPLVDGIAQFVILDENGNMQPVAAGQSPVYDTDYKRLSAKVKKTAYDSHCSNLLELEIYIADKLIEQESSDDETTSETSADTAESVTTVSEETTTVSEETSQEAPAETTAPIETYTESVTELPSSVTEREAEAVTAGTSVTEEYYTASETEFTAESEKDTVTSKSEVTSTNKPKTQTMITTTKTTANSVSVYVSTPHTTAGTVVTTVPTSYVTTVPTASDVTTTPTSEETTTEKKDVFTVNFYGEDGKLIYTSEAEEGTTLESIPAVPTKTGYTGKWMYNGREFTAATVVTKDMTVKAEYTINTYEVVFTAEGTTVDTQTVNYGENVASIPTIPAKTNYTGKWMYNGSEFTAATAVTKDMTVEAEYTINTYEVVFTAEGTAVDTQTVNYGENVASIPDVPAKPGYTGKWMYNGSEFTAATAVTKDMTVEAEYTAEIYSITYKAVDLADSSELTADFASYSDSSEYGALITDLTTADGPEITGYDFAGWLADDAEITADSKVSGDIVLTATYNKQTFTYSFNIVDLDGNLLETLDEGTAEYGETITAYSLDTTAYREIGGSRYIHSSYVEGLSDDVWDNTEFTITEDAEFNSVYIARTDICELVIASGYDSRSIQETVILLSGSEYTLPDPAETTSADGTYVFKGWGNVTSGIHSTGAIPGDKEEDTIDLNLNSSSIGIAPDYMSIGETITVTPTYYGTKIIAAKYVPTSVSVSYVAQNESGGAISAADFSALTDTAAYEANLSEFAAALSPPEITISGWTFTFKKWMLKHVNYGTVEIGSGDLITSDITLIAVYTVTENP